MDWNNPIIYPAFFSPHLMFEHRHLRLQTLPNEEIKRKFTPMILSPGQSTTASPSVSSQKSDTLNLLLFVREAPTTL